jgi:hypothetical protein
MDAPYVVMMGLATSNLSETGELFLPEPLEFLLAYVLQDLVRRAVGRTGALVVTTAMLVGEHVACPGLLAHTVESATVDAFHRRSDTSSVAVKSNRLKTHRPSHR